MRTEQREGFMARQVRYQPSPLMSFLVPAR